MLAPRFQKDGVLGPGVLASGDAERLELNVTNVTVYFPAPSFLCAAGAQGERTKVGADVGALKK
jgi:hypothetical protein